ncbi:MAG TPA: hypothetical protein VF070_36445 [Streptosporangiaceae bacterium]
MNESRRVGEARVWAALCRHIDGMAIGTTMAALSSHGALRTLAAAERTAFGKLRAGLGANAGFLHVAIRLLADQGWVGLAGEGGTDELVITPTPPGRVVMTQPAGAYESLPHATVELAERDWGLPPAAAAGPGQSNSVSAEVRRQVLSHLNGHLIAPLMFATTSRGFRQGCRDLTETATRILALEGWARDGELTPDGEIALTMARQYRYPIVYLPLLRCVPELIFGDPSRALSRDQDAHLDRDLDLRFSGEVFAAMCRAPFLEMALPLFGADPGAQPALVVDTGCGDGTLLETLYAAVRERTARGRCLDEHPLLMVGVDPSPVARRTAAVRLAAAGVPHLILDGDIADPDGLARELAAAGHDASNALHVCKSAIHDRAYRAPVAVDDRAPVTTTAFALPDGDAIPATQMALNLADLFRAWRPLAARHGWIVIEAHSVPAPTAATLIGRTLATALDATHGYSCQYPVEPEVYAWAARAAGFTSRAHREPAAEALGHTLLTIDHFMAQDG